MKKIGTVLSFFLIIGVIFYSFYSLMPSDNSGSTVPDSEFSIDRALIPLKEISKAPHYLGSIEHERVRFYLISQLKSMGLQVEEQTGFVLQEELKSLDKPKNIIGRIKGATDGKALLYCRIMTVPKYIQTVPAMQEVALRLF